MDQKNRVSLNDVEWGEFKIKDLFETFIGSNGLQTPTGSYIPKKDLIESTIPRITVRDTNNGIDSYSESMHKNYRVFNNFISVSFMGSAFYHPYLASLDMKVHALIPKNIELTKNIGNFLIRSLRNNTKLFSYGNQLSSTDLPRQKILLPIDDENSPNWQFMEAYMKQIEEKLLERYRNYKLLNCNNLRGGVKHPAKWKEFFIEEVFEIKSGKRLIKADMMSGNIPFVGATDCNNGITEFIANKNSSLDKNILGVNYNGSVVCNFYHPYKAIFSDDVKRLSFRNIVGNKYSFLFAKAVILQQKIKYEYGYKFNGERMKRQKILLPTTVDGKPDYAYMENYMKDLEYKKIKKYLKYKGLL